MSKTIATILTLRDQFSSTINKATASTKGFQQQIKHTQNEMTQMRDGITAGFKSIAAKAGGLIAGIGLLDLGKQAVMLSSDLNEVQNVVDVTFGNSAETINQWSQSALQGFGLSELQAKQFNGTLGALMKSSGISGDALSNMSTKLTGLAGDFASFYNLQPEEAFEKIKSGISGETEPLKALGINMSVANLQAFALSQGISKAYDKMSQAEQTTLRYNYLMQKSADAQGDFTRTNKGFANQLRIAETTMKQIGANAASNILPLLNNGLIKLNGFLDVLPKGVKVIKDFATELKSTSDPGEVFEMIVTKVDSLLYKTLPKKAADFFSSLISAIIGFGLDVIESVKNTSYGIKAPFFDAINSIKAFISNRMQEIQPILDKFTKNSTPIIENAFNKIRDAIIFILTATKDVFNFVNNNWKVIEPVIVGITGALGFYKLAIMALSAKTLIQTGLTQGLAIAQGILNTVMNLSPLAKWAIIIGVAIAAGVYLYQNWDMIKQKAYELWQGIQSAFAPIGDFFAGLWGGVKSGFSSFINFMINGINSFTGALSWIPNQLSNVPGFSWASNFVIPKIPNFETGTQYFSGGLAQINERGGEIVNLPNGSQVIPADKSEKVIKNSGGHTFIFNFNGNVGTKEFFEQVGAYIADKMVSTLDNM